MSTADGAAPRPGFFARVRNFAVELWGVLVRPSSVFGLGVLVMAGFVAGVIFWGAFNTALELTNTEKFCTGCHEMRDNVFAELKSTVHFTNRSGVRAICISAESEKSASNVTSAQSSRVTMRSPSRATPARICLP